MLELKFKVSKKKYIEQKSQDRIKKYIFRVQILIYIKSFVRLNWKKKYTYIYNKIKY